MWFFGKKKKQKEAELKKQAEMQKQAELKKEEEAKQQVEEVQEVPVKEEPIVEEVQVAPVKEEPIVEEVKEEPIVEEVKEEPKTEEPVVVEAPKPFFNKDTTATYEIFPEAGMFKYRLKTSEGDILAVSFGYTSRNSAKNGIKTFRKCVEEGSFEIVTDKAGFAHYDLFGSRGARVVLIGEFHKTVAKTELEVEAVKALYNTTKIVDLEEIPAKEIREEIVPKQDIEDNPNGKYELDRVGPKSFFIRLTANNGQLLLVSQSYASKQAALNGLEAIKRALKNQNFTIHRDKQNRYQFKLHTDNMQLLVSGETYADKTRCVSSIQSAIRFGREGQLAE